MTSFAQRGNPDLLYAGQSVDGMIAADMRDHDVPGGGDRAGFDAALQKAVAAD